MTRRRTEKRPDTETKIPTVVRHYVESVPVLTLEQRPDGTLDVALPDLQRGGAEGAIVRLRPAYGATAASIAKIVDELKRQGAFVRVVAPSAGVGESHASSNEGAMSPESYTVVRDYQAIELELSEIEFDDESGLRTEVDNIWGSV